MQSFNRAADALAVTQPSFSMLIKELERDIGTQLFDRTTRTCRLTEAGHVFYQELQGSLDHIEQAYGNARDIAPR